MEFVELRWLGRRLLRRSGSMQGGTRAKDGVILGGAHGVW